MPPYPPRNWVEAWTRLSPEERTAALDAFFAEMDSGAALKWREHIRRQMARAARFREQTIRSWPPERLRPLLARHIAQVMEPRTWNVLFLSHYKRNHSSLMVRFMDLLGLSHDGSGITDSPVRLPKGPEVEVAVNRLRAEFAPEEIANYFDVLMLNDSAWAPLRSSRDRLVRDEAPDDKLLRTAEAPTAAQPDAAEEEKGRSDALTDEFITLDRVLIDQIIAGVSGTEGALSHDALEDLIEDFVSLNPKRHRSYFHLGMLDVLVPDRSLEFDRPEMNDSRRQWYLAGALSGLARRRDSDAIRELLQKRGGEFRGAAGKAGGPGEAIAKALLAQLIDLGRFSEATLLLQGQLQVPGGERLAWITLEKASEFLRTGDLGSAMPLVKVLWENRDAVPGDPEEIALIKSRLRRRMGQCLQAKGDFEGARSAFAPLLEGEADGLSAEVLSDIGLIAGNFRSLSDVRLPEGKNKRQAMVDALARGQELFERAISDHGSEAINAHYALAVLEYLRWTSTVGPAKDDLRDAALGHAQQAVSGMRLSESAEAYEQLGLLGQALMMQAVLQMNRLDAVEANAAIAAWNQITPAAGKFAQEDVVLLVEAAEAVDEEKAILVAESIWRHRRQGAFQLLAGRGWLLRSDFLRGELLEQARDQTNPAKIRFRLWTDLVPRLLILGKTAEAEEGLDTLEGLSNSIELGELFLQWLERREHFDPAWNEYETMWSRVRMARQLGKDEVCARLLRELFFSVRDQRVDEAEEILALFRAWNLPREHYDGLESSLPLGHLNHTELPDTEARLREGERVRVLFVGGNETQKQYDEEIQRSLRQDYPGIAVSFHHTGWSSNWGRQLPGLVQEANVSDAVVLMTIMRTMLGRELRRALRKPWVSCAARGRDGMWRSIRKAAGVALRNRDRH